MELIRGLHNLQPRHRGCVATIGAFDGMHLGHQAVIRQLDRERSRRGVPAAVVTFEPLPREYLRPDEAPPRLMSFRERMLALRAAGVDRVLCLPFQESLRQMSAVEFIDAVLDRGLGIDALIVGDDTRFGRAREGTVDVIREQGQERGYATLPTDTLTVAGERVSSTRIREALQTGDLALAAELIGRPYSICGRVEYGQQLGRQLGTPTANIALRRPKVALNGVFTVRVEGPDLSGAAGIANIGVRPTVEQDGQPHLEVHLLEGSPDLYGAHLKVEFLHRLREERTFSGLEALQAAIRDDVARARAWFDAQPQD